MGVAIAMLLTAVYGLSYMVWERNDAIERKDERIVQLKDAYERMYNTADQQARLVDYYKEQYEDGVMGNIPWQHRSPYGYINDVDEDNVDL